MTATIRAVAVDDEPLALLRIRKALQRHADVELVEEVGDGEAAVQRIIDAAPDVLFLDIHMPGRDGFDVLTALAPAQRPLVVFVTAYDEHAVRAFRVHATDYLIKPFDDDRFDEMMANVRARLRRGANVMRQELQALLADLGVGSAHAHRLRVTSGQRTQFVSVATIRYLASDGNYVVIHTTSDKHRIRATMKELHDVLDPATFVRVHRGTVLNLDYVREIQPWFSGDYVAILQDGEQIRISRHYRDDILRTSF
jgi:two-component system, LytTR family, response regulator